MPASSPTEARQCGSVRGMESIYRQHIQGQLTLQLLKLLHEDQAVHMCGANVQPMFALWFVVQSLGAPNGPVS